MHVGGETNGTAAYIFLHLNILWTPENNTEASPQNSQIHQEKMCPKDKDLLLTQPVAGVIGASFRWLLLPSPMKGPDRIEINIFFSFSGVSIMVANILKLFQVSCSFAKVNMNVFLKWLLATDEKMCKFIGKGCKFATWHFFFLLHVQTKLLCYKLRPSIFCQLGYTL